MTGPAPVAASHLPSRLWRAFGRSLAVLVVLLAAVANEAAADPAPAPVDIDTAAASFAGLPEPRRLRILINMTNAGEHEAAAALVARVPFEGATGPGRNRFVEGLVLRARGDLRGAARLFRAILADQPDLTLVRAELARTLVALDERDSARHHLELLAAAAPTPELARNFDDFIAAIDADRPWSFNAWVSLAPSTNFTNGTSTRTVIVAGLPFEVDAESRGKSGIGLRGGANAGYTHRLGDGLALVGGAGVQYSEYAGDRYDDLVLSQQVELRRDVLRGSIGVGVAASQRWSGPSEFYWAVGPQATLRQRLGANLSVQSQLRHQWIDYKVADWRNGTAWGLDNRLGYALSPSRVAYAMGGFERTDTQRAYLDGWSWWSGLGLYQELSWGLTLYTEAQLRRTLFDADHPLIGKPREDTRLDLRATLTKRDFEVFGLAPQLEYTYVRNLSNDPMSRFHGHGANLTLTKAF